jgi:hypothetical protein
MDVSRAERIAEVLKTTKKLSENVQKPATAKISPKLITSKPEGPAALPPVVEGTGFIRILMYIIAGLLIIGLILLAVDQWITPVFQRKPGGSGFILIPGVDSTELHWKTLKDVDDIVIGAQPSGSTARTLYTNVIEGQTNYSITMDVYIRDQFPQDLGSGQNKRIFFMIGTTPTTPTLTAWLANDKNTVYVTAFDTNGLQESVEFENVPIKKPFRIGIVKTPYAMEGYLDGLLVKTRQIRSANKIPTTGDKIFSSGSIVVGGKTLSQNIAVLQLRIFGYSAETSEMRGRMNDLATVEDFNPPKTIR